MGNNTTRAAGESTHRHQRKTFAVLIWLVVCSSFSLAQASPELFLKRAHLGGSSLQTLNLRFDSATEKNQPAQYIVQFKNTVQATDRQQLVAAGLQVKGYVPDHALLVIATAQQLRQVSQLQTVQNILSFRAQWKLSEDFGAVSVFNQNESRDIQIRLLEGESADSVKSQIAQAHGSILQESERALFARIPAAALMTLAQNNAVEWIQPLPHVQTMMYDLGPAQVAPRLADDQLTGYESGTRVMKFDAAWERGFNGKGQMVAMADTGLDTGSVDTIHPDYKDAVVGGIAMGYFSDSWGDPQGHGTHVSGSVISNGSLSNGLVRGGAWGAKYFAEGMWSPILDNLGVPSSLGKLFQPAYDKGARVHTNSWGAASNFGVYENMAAQVDDFMWQHPDMLVLFAAGNSGIDKDHDGVIDLNSVSPPATAKNALTVGASENFVTKGGRQETLSSLRGGKDNWGVPPLADDTLSNNPEGMACFSSRGPTNDGRVKPEIVAPGTNILSGRSHYPNATVLWGAYNDSYVWAGGTSMATPLTAGAAAVARQYLTDRLGFANPSAALVKATLMHTAHDMFPGQYGTGPTQEIPKHRPNVQEGYGRVDMDAATSLEPNSTLMVDEKTGLGTGDSKSFGVVVGPDGQLHATLSYTDAPGLTSASKALVNDLGLEVRDKAGNVVAQADTHVDNSESVELSGLTPGAYTVNVLGTSVPQGHDGKQPYALLVTARIR